MAGQEKLKVTTLLAVDEKKSIKAINEAIQRIENSSSLKKLNIQLNVDKTLSGSIKQMNASIEQPISGMLKKVTALADAITGLNGIKTLKGHYEAITWWQENWRKLAEKAGPLGDRIAAALGSSGIMAKASAGALNTFGRSLAITAVAARGFATALASVAAPMLIFTALGFAIEKIVGHFRKLKEQQKEIEQRQNTVADSMGNHADQVYGLKKQYEELYAATHGGKVFADADQAAKYKDVVQQLAALMPSLVAGTNEHGEAILKTGQEMENEFALAKELVKLKREEQLLNAKSKYKEELKDIKAQVKERDKLNDKLKLGGRVYRDTLVPFTDKEKNRFKQQLLEIDSDIQGHTTKIRQEMNLTTQNLVKSFGVELPDGLANSMTDFVNGIEGLSELSDDGIDTKASAIANFFASLNSLRNSKTQGDIDKYTKRVNDFGVSSGIAADQIKWYIDNVKVISETVEPAASNQEEMNKAFEQAQQAYKDSTGELANLNQMIDNVSKKQSLNSETIVDLIQKYPQLASHVIKNGDAWTIEAEALEGLQQIKIQEAETALQTQIDSTKATLENVTSRVSAFGIEIQAIKDLKSAYEETSKLGFARIYGEDAFKDAKFDDISKKITIDGQTSDWSDDPDQYDRIKQSFEDQKAAYDAAIKYGGLLESNDKLLQMLSDPKYGVSSSSRTSSKEKTFDLYTADAYAQKLEDISLAFDILNTTKAETNEKSAEYIKLLEEEIKLNMRSQDAAHEEANRLRGLNTELISKRDELSKTSEQYQTLSKEIDDNNSKIKGLQSSWQGYKQKIISINQSIGDTTQAIKDQQKELNKGVYEKIREEELKAIEKVANAEDKRHQDRMDHLDNEMNKYQEAIDMVRKSMDRSDDEADFNKNLGKLQSEELGIRKKIDAMSLDNSIEGQYKREQLEQELADKLEEIEKLKTDRSRELRSDNLVDLADTKKKQVDLAKKAEDAEYNANKEKLDHMKNDIDSYWNDVINNETTYLQSQEQIISKHLANVQSSLQSFAAGASSIWMNISRDIGKSVTDITSVFPTNNLGQNKAEQADIEKMRANSQAWAKSNNITEREYLARENKIIGDEHGWYRDETTGIWYGNDGAPLYHEGGEAGIPGTTTRKWWDKLLKSNEVPAILKKGEVVLDNPISWVNSLVSRTLSGLSSFAPRAAAVSSGDTHYHLDINIDKLLGGKEGANILFSEVKKGMQTGKYK